MQAMSKSLSRVVGTPLALLSPSLKLPQDPLPPFSRPIPWMSDWSLGLPEYSPTLEFGAQLPRLSLHGPWGTPHTACSLLTESVSQGLAGHSDQWLMSGSLIPSIENQFYLKGNLVLNKMDYPWDTLQCEFIG